MAFDGITVAAVTCELKNTILGGRINKIAQPEADEIILTIKNSGRQYRLFLSADASLPLVYLTDNNKTSPVTAPSFCMLLRKYLSNAKITNIIQPSFERIIRFELEHLNELGDMCKKVLIIEIMGKHSNIILTDDNDVILDGIKHVSSLMSSVREVLPGKKYFVPVTENKLNPLMVCREDFQIIRTEVNMPVYKALYSCFTGLSPLISHEICKRAHIDSEYMTYDLNSEMVDKLYESFSYIMSFVKREDFTPRIFYENDEPKDYAGINIGNYTKVKEYNSISGLLQEYYEEKNILVRIRQRSSDLRRIVTTALERDVKKFDLQVKQLRDTEKKEKYKLYGELLSAYGYNIETGAKEARVENYYDNNKEIVIPLDENLSAIENSKKYYDRYNKLKRTAEALSSLTAQTKNEIEHLESIIMSLDIARFECDLQDIKEELIVSGFIRRKGIEKKKSAKSKPFHYVDADGNDYYVGKNNFQNDELTFKFASGNDWWFHAKKAPGSHVIVKPNNQTKMIENEPQLDNKVYERAAALAAYYSKVKDQDKVEIDYTLKKNVKKPNGAAPGFVVYYTNYSMIASPDISDLNEV